MGITLADSILEAGFEMNLPRRHYLELGYCLEGYGTVEELDTGAVHAIWPGTLYTINAHDNFRIIATDRMRLICTYLPALTGQEKHYVDG